MKFKLIRQVAAALACISFFMPIGGAAPQPTNNVEINVAGLQGDVLKNVTSRLEILKNNIYTAQMKTLKERYYQNILTQVQDALTPFGYFKPKINIRIYNVNQYWMVKITVDPGPRLIFDKVTVNVTGEGSTDTAYAKALLHLPVKQGDYFNSEKYDQSKEALQYVANVRGYFDAKFTTSKLVVDLRNYTSEVILEFETGKRYRFGDTIFSASQIKQSLLQRYLEYQPGDYYSSKLLEQSRLNLAGSNYFQQVVMIPELREARDFKVPILTELYPQDQVTYSLGAGYGTDTGVRALASMDLRWLNASGHSLKTLLRGSQNNSQLAASYMIPVHRPAYDSIIISGGAVRINQTTGTGQNAQLSVGYQTLMYDWHFNAGITNLIEKYSLNNYPITGVTTKTNANVLYPQITLQRMSSGKELLNPSQGYNIYFTAAGGSKSFGSKTDFTQTRLDAKFLYTFELTHTRLLARAALGAISIANLSNLPLSMQFYAGGASSIRGFTYNSIGPGRYLAVGSFEIQQRIKGKIYLGGFIDAGNVNNRITKSKVRIGAGPALIYLSPIGAIELSIAKNASPTDGHWRIQFSMGALL